MPEIVIPAPMDLNTTGCIPSDTFVQMLSYVVMKTDAIKLGLVCFVAGMILMWIFGEIGKRWK
jgi:hypothetical protein